MLTDKIKSADAVELERIAADMRSNIINVIRKNGGHLASNLGVVEVTVALYKVFDFPKDKLIFDVGHQCYAHKIITRGREAFSSIRKKGGLSGFPKSGESVYDCYDFGHSSTSLSVACGFMRARKLKGENFEIISLIGDGALSGGMIYEALGDAYSIGEKQIIILNDNKMSISPTVGGMSAGLSDTAGTKEFFARFGFKYVDGVDGHDIGALIDAFTAAKNGTEPVVIRVSTRKGKGLDEATVSPEKYHSVSAESPAGSYSAVAGETLKEMAATDGDIVAVTAAMKDGTGLSAFAEAYPDRFIDVGICEEHAATMCGAMAKAGLKPYFAVYSSFMQRAFDQIIHDNALQNLDVKYLVDRSGAVNDDGETHQGIFNLSFLSLIPNMKIVAPKNFADLKYTLPQTLAEKGPIAVRYPKSSLSEGDDADQTAFGRWAEPDSDADGIILTTGAVMYAKGVKLAKSIMKNGLKLSTVNAKYIWPLDENWLTEFADKPIMILEDNERRGGFYEAVLSFYADKGLRAELTAVNFPQSFLCVGTLDELLDEYGFSDDRLLSVAGAFFAK